MSRCPCVVLCFLVGDPQGLAGAPWMALGASLPHGSRLSPCSGCITVISRQEVKRYIRESLRLAPHPVSAPTVPMESHLCDFRSCTSPLRRMSPAREARHMPP